MFDAPDAYDAFMGRYSSRLAPAFADFGHVGPGQRVVDVGSGPGALTAELLRRGADVSAADPSGPFVEALRQRFPGVDAQVAPAERLPFGDGAFDAALAQLVVQFMDDPLAGVREMARVTRAGGTVAACVWDIGSHRSPLSPFWSAVRRLGLPAAGEENLAGVKEGQLAELFARAGLVDVESGEVSVTVEHPSFQEWWEPYTLGVGPPGSYLKTRSSSESDAIREEARALLGPDPIRVHAVAWAARGYNPARLAA